MRLMGLDYGTRTVGVAISDLLGLTAQGIETIEYKEHTQHRIYDRLAELIKEYEIDKIVVGMPRHMNGDIGERGLASEKFGSGLERKFKLPVVYYDERLTTVAAERVLLQADVSRKKRKKVIDKIAAVFILQGYLDQNGGF